MFIKELYVYIMFKYGLQQTNHKYRFLSKYTSTIYIYIQDIYISDNICPVIAVGICYICTELKVEYVARAEVV